MRQGWMVVLLSIALLGCGAVLARAADLKVGDPAPDFRLQATDGKTYTLADFQGKQAVVLAWFPKAYTRGCTIECKSLAEHGVMITKYQVMYFMISVDPLEQNAGFAAQEHADFPLLSDPTKAIAAVYGVLNASGVANRWTFYIDKDGRIAAIDKAVRPETSAEDMAARLAALHVPVRPAS